MRKWLRDKWFEILEDLLRITIVWAFLEYFIRPMEVVRLPDINWWHCFIMSMCVNLLMNQQQIRRWHKP
jgi:hypothetical protein